MEMHLQAKIKLNSEMYLEAVIKRGWRCTWRPRLSEFGDALGGQDKVELRDALGGHDHVTQRYTWRP